MKNSPIQPRLASGEVATPGKEICGKLFPAGSEMEKMTLGSRNEKVSMLVKWNLPGNKELRYKTLCRSIPQTTSI